MSIRPFKLPGDVPVLVELIPPAFQYPDNPEWSVQPDEMENLVDTFNSIRRIWPIFRVMQVISPPLRDVLRGYVWEEDGKAVGLTNVLRQGATDCWMIGNVAVLPEYRGRGIARKLVQTSMDLARSRGARGIILDVVAGNIPACTLYEKLGFEHYSGQAQLDFEQADPPAELPIPEGYTIEKAKRFDWKPRYQLARRITPAAVQKYVPVEEKGFRQPAPMRALAPIFMTATGINVQPYFARDAGGQVVATTAITARSRAGGMNQISITLDPAHAALAPSLLRFLVHRAVELAPGRRIEFMPHHWQEALIEAALEAGFNKRLDTLAMGYTVK